MTAFEGAIGSGKVLYRGERFIARDESLFAFGRTLTVQRRRTVRPKRRRSWTEEAMTEAMAWILGQGEDGKDYLVLGPDGTKEIAERVVAGMRAV